MLNGYFLTDEHAASSYGIPVLVAPDGEALGPLDIIGESGGTGNTWRPARFMVERWLRLASRTAGERTAGGRFLCPRSPEPPTDGDDDDAFPHLPPVRP